MLHNYFSFLMYIISKANKWSVSELLYAFCYIPTSVKNYTAGRGTFLICFIPNVSKIQHSLMLVFSFVLESSMGGRERGKTSSN